MTESDARTVPFRVAAVDDHVVVLNGILWTINRHAPWITVAGTHRTVAELLASPPVDVVLLDLDLKGNDPDESDNVRRILEWGAVVLIFTAMDDKPARIRRAFHAGASGLALKSDSGQELVEALQAARAGEASYSSRLAHTLVTDEHLIAHMTAREIEVFRLLAQGVDRRQIGRLVSPPISEHTVTEYLNRVTRRYRDMDRPTHNVHDTLRHAVSDGHLELPTVRPPHTDRPI